jgi:periplasmic divalent cation tolerance protein
MLEPLQVIILASMSMSILLGVASRRYLSCRTPATVATTVMVSVPSEEVGQRIANALVEERLAACVQIVGGVTSVYRWKEKVESDVENLLLIKTREELVELLIARVSSLHPYDTPEIISLPIVAGSSQYLNWLLDSTKHRIDV